MLSCIAAHVLVFKEAQILQSTLAVWHVGVRGMLLRGFRQLSASSAEGAAASRV